ncbi:DUF2240 family protein, partial [bacterium]|nr:DUF2240 family protein [bacterium]
SMDLNWFSPAQAKEFMKQALRMKTLMKKGNRIKPNFDYKQIVVPVGFHPSLQTLGEKKEKDEQEEPPEITSKIVQKIIEKTAKDKQSVIEWIKSVENEKNICFDIAALMVGKEYDVILEDCFEEIENKIFRKETI